MGGTNGDTHRSDSPCTDSNHYPTAHRSGPDTFGETHDSGRLSGDGSSSGLSSWDTHNSDFPYTDSSLFPTARRSRPCNAARMTRPRFHIAPPDTPGTYHCIQRCVRRAFLCGVDDYSGRSFEHRNSWIETRIALVAECFAVSIHAYAVMSNHLHLVIDVDPATAMAWSDEEVATRWVRLFPPHGNTEAAIKDKRLRLLEQPARLAIIRRRLGSLSWLMRCLVEPIARRANREDGCTGRFWEGRYKCRSLCDERSLLAAMTYVDLNPIRAGIAENLETSTHTSVARRIAAARQDPATLARPLAPIAGNLRRDSALSTANYLQILDWTGGSTAADKADASRTRHRPSCRSSIATRSVGRPGSPPSAAAGPAPPARRRT